MPSPTASEPITPELVLVAPPDVAADARASLSEPSTPATSSRQVVAKREPARTPVVHVIDLDAVERLRPRSHTRLRVASAIVIALAVAAGAVMAVAGHSAPDRNASRRVATAAAVKHRAAPRRPTRPKPQHGRRAHSLGQRHVQPSGGATRPAKPRPQRKRVKPKKTHPPEKRPVAAKSIRAPKSAPFVPARLFTWPEQDAATAYVVRFFRNGRRVALLHTKKPRVALPRSFRFDAGRYRWQVFPVVAGKLAAAVVDSTFVLPGG